MISLGTSINIIKNYLLMMCLQEYQQVLIAGLFTNAKNMACQISAKLHVSITKPNLSVPASTGT
jgi:hypothetical protein